MAFVFARWDGEKTNADRVNIIEKVIVDEFYRLRIPVQ